MVNILENSKESIVKKYDNFLFESQRIHLSISSPFPIALDNIDALPTPISADIPPFIIVKDMDILIVNSDSKVPQAAFPVNRGAAPVRGRLAVAPEPKDRLTF